MQAWGEGQGFGRDWAAYRLLPPYQLVSHGGRSAGTLLGAGLWVRGRGSATTAAFRLLPPPLVRLPMVDSVLGQWLQLRLDDAWVQAADPWRWLHRLAAGRGQQAEHRLQQLHRGHRSADRLSGSALQPVRHWRGVWLC